MATGVQVYELGLLSGLAYEGDGLVQGFTGIHPDS